MLKFTKNCCLLLALLILSPPGHSEDSTQDWVNRERDRYDHERTTLQQQENQAQRALQQSESARRYALKMNDKQALPIAERAVITARQALDQLRRERIRLDRRLAAVDLLAASSPKYTSASASHVSGHVEVEASTGWHRIDENFILKPGQSIRTGDDGNAELLFSDGSVINLGHSSHFLLETSDDLQSLYRLLQGRIKVAIKRLGRRQYAIRTPTASIGVRGTEFLVQTDDNGATAIAVMRGTVELTAIEAAKNLSVTQGERAILMADGTMQGPEPFDFRQLSPWWNDDTNP